MLDVDSVEQLGHVDRRIVLTIYSYTKIAYSGARSPVPLGIGALFRSFQNESVKSASS